jgi:MYXO-CTERM domain-containing protein
MGGETGSGEAGSDAPAEDSSVFSDSSASGGAGGSSGGTAGSSGTANWDGGSGKDATVVIEGDGANGSISDGGLDQQAGRVMGGGCACSSGSHRGAGSRSIYGLLMLVAARLIRRRWRTREEASLFHHREHIMEMNSQ